jgi:hypothetical protein
MIACPNIRVLLWRKRRDNVIKLRRLPPDLTGFRDHFSALIVLLRGSNWLEKASMETCQVLT